MQLLSLVSQLEPPQEEYRLNVPSFIFFVIIFVAFPTRFVVRVPRGVVVAPHVFLFAFILPYLERTDLRMAKELAVYVSMVTDGILPVGRLTVWVEISVFPIFQFFSVVLVLVWLLPSFPSTTVPSNHRQFVFSCFIR